MFKYPKINSENINNERKLKLFVPGNASGFIPNFAPKSSSRIWILDRDHIAEKIGGGKNNIKIVKDAFAQRPYASNFSAWIFDEETCAMKPPIPRPDDGQQWRWSGAENNWKIAPDRPNDGKAYTFDFDTWVWIELV